MKKPRNNQRADIHRVGLIANSDKPASRVALQRAISLITKAGHQAATDEASASFAKVKCETHPDFAALAKAVDVLLVFGGDGTILRVVAEIDGSQTPILGINVGRLGFLTAVPSHQLAPALKKLWERDFVIERRSLIEAAAECSTKPVTMSALNDIVISHGAASRVIDVDVSVDGEQLTRYRGDGLIVSSPTGSTAYSLSAGGPIIKPDANVFAITPICAHALSNRSLVVSLDSTIKVKLVTENVETIVAADGHLETSLGVGDVVTIRRSSRIVNLLHPGGTSFFETIRRKLHWSGSAV
ncbi:MAG: ppnK [Verrucomicrobiales bacterium]|nr:ppnK [Verrucomicrobiales bacterium]